MSIGRSDLHIILTPIVATQPKGGSTVIQKVCLDIVPAERPDPDPVAANVVILDSVSDTLRIDTDSAAVAQLVPCDN